MRRILTAMLLAFCCITASAQLVSPAPVPMWRAFDSNGKPLIGGKLFTYVAGTSTTLATYSDAAQTSPNTNPVILDATGQARVFLGNGTYKLVLQNSLGVQQWSIDNIVGGAPILSGPFTTQTITQPDAAHPLFVNFLTVTGNLSASYNGVINATLLPGNNLGAQVQAAVTSLAGKCGVIYIPRGTYTWSTQKVAMLPCQTLDGEGSIVNVPNMSGNPFLIYAGPPNFDSPSLNVPETYTPGGIRNMTFQGPGSGITGSVGMMIGGDPTGALTPATYFSFLQKFDNIHFSAFGCAINFGNGFQIAFMGGVIENNDTGICFKIPNVALENINFHGTQIDDNATYGIYSPDATVFSELNMYGVSLDYNGQAVAGGAVVANNMQLSMFGGHIENRRGPFVSLTGKGVMTINGMSFNLVDGNADVWPSFISIAGTDILASLSNINASIGTGASVANFVNWTATGTHSRLFIDGFQYRFNGTPLSLVLLNSFTNIPHYSVPLYDGSGNQQGYTTDSSQFQLGNFQGSLTSATAGGGFTGINGAANFSIFMNGSTATNPNWNNAAVFNSVQNITENAQGGTISLQTSALTRMQVTTTGVTTNLPFSAPTIAAGNGVTVSGASCTVKAIVSGIITSATCP